MRQGEEEEEEDLAEQPPTPLNGPCSMPSRTRTCLYILLTELAYTRSPRPSPNKALSLSPPTYLSSVRPLVFSSPSPPLARRTPTNTHSDMCMCARAPRRRVHTLPRTRTRTASSARALSLSFPCVKFMRWEGPSWGVVRACAHYDGPLWCLPCPLPAHHAARPVSAGGGGGGRGGGGGGGGVEGGEGGRPSARAQTRAYTYTQTHRHRHTHCAHTPRRR